MILVADSGSSKCDWAFFDYENNQLKIVKTIGLNPYFLSAEKILKELHKSTDLCKISTSITSVFFYGAGCSENSSKKILNKALSKFFNSSKVYVEHDLLGACRSISDKGISINCILGTGSISCIYDQKKIKLPFPSLGYVLGDEGSGNYFGKKILNLYFTNQLPKKLKEDFKKEYNISYQNLMKKVYNNERSNYFLASFFPFLIKHQNNPIILNILKEGVSSFLKTHVFLIPDFQIYKINFFGSVSFFLKDLIIEELKQKKCMIGSFQKKIILGLFDYHDKK